MLTSMCGAHLSHLALAYNNVISEHRTLIFQLLIGNEQNYARLLGA